MNNPDEETAAEQFGKGDKYFDYNPDGDPSRTPNVWTRAV